MTIRDAATRTHLLADDLAVIQARLERLDVKDTLCAKHIVDAMDSVDDAIMQLNAATRRLTALAQQDERSRDELIARLEASIAERTRCAEVGER